MAERTSEQIKYLELLQANIARMHEAAVSMKRFAVVGFALGGSMSKYLNESLIMLFTIALVAAFWILDAKYLQTERSFKKLYDQTRCEAVENKASFALTAEKAGLIPFSELASWSTWLLYAPILATLAIVYSLWVVR